MKFTEEYNNLRDRVLKELFRAPDQVGHLAEKIGVHEYTLMSLLRGEKPIRKPTILKLKQYFATLDEEKNR